MGVELRIKFARGVVAEGCCTEVACGMAMFVMACDAQESGGSSNIEENTVDGSVPALPDIRFPSGSGEAEWF